MVEQVRQRDTVQVGAAGDPLGGIAPARAGSGAEDRDGSGGDPLSRQRDGERGGEAEHARERSERRQRRELQQDGEVLPLTEREAERGGQPRRGEVRIAERAEERHPPAAAESELEQDQRGLGASGQRDGAQGKARVPAASEERIEQEGRGAVEQERPGLARVDQRGERGQREPAKRQQQDRAPGSGRQRHQRGQRAGREHEQLGPEEGARQRGNDRGQEREVEQRNDNPLAHPPMLARGLSYLSD